jgi:type IV pilus assembly protein PilB
VGTVLHTIAEARGNSPSKVDDSTRRESIRTTESFGASLREKSVVSSLPRADITDKIGYILLKKGVVDYETLEQALAIKDSESNKKDRRNLGQILVTEFGVDHDSVFREVANLYAFHEIYLADENIDEQRADFIKKMVEVLPEKMRDLLVESKILPLKYDENQPNKLIIIASDPTDRNIPLIARNFGVRKYEVVYCRLRDIQALLEQIIPAENEYLKLIDTNEVSFDVDEKDDEAAIDEEALEAEIGKSALINLVEGALVEAVRQGASDIHVIPREGKRTELHFRIDGNLRLWHVQENTTPEAIIAVVKDRSKGVDRFEREAAQDGFVQRVIDGNQIRFRVSILPMAGKDFHHKYESIVLRVLDDRKVITDLGKLGLVGPAKDLFQKAINQPQGMIILTGPTGSGKSTTIVAALSHVIDPTVNVLTVEEPVEYIIKGARQLKLGPKMDFDQALRGILRHDPDIVLVGEMRDRASAEIAIKLSNTGHLTFSTLHTNDAPSAIARLYKMGIEPFLLAYSINIIVAQRLVRTLCTLCREPIKEEEKAAYLKFGFSEEELAKGAIYDAAGCNKCNGGYKGRCAIHEALYFTREIRHLILESGADIDENAIREQAIKDGMWTLRQAGMQRVLEGVTTMQEVLGTTIED